MSDTTIIYKVTVNGTLIKTPHEKLSAGDIIRLAIKQGAGGISGQPEGYVLQALNSDREFQARRHRQPPGVQGVHHREVWSDASSGG